MSILHRDQVTEAHKKKITKKFLKTLRKVAKKYTVRNLFQDFRNNGGTHVESMILDSALKGIDLTTLPSTLLLLEINFYKNLENATSVLEKLSHKKTIHPILTS